MADDEIFTLIHGLQEKTVKLKGKIMTSSGLERVHMCWKNVCLFVSRQFWRADLTQVSSSAWPRGRLTPEWGWVRKCLLAFNVIKLVKLWSLKIFENLNFVSHGSGRPPWVGFNFQSHHLLAKGSFVCIARQGWAFYGIWAGNIFWNSWNYKYIILKT